jgi:hypothetical protein
MRASDAAWLTAGCHRLRAQWYAFTLVFWSYVCLYFLARVYLVTHFTVHVSTRRHQPCVLCDKDVSCLRAFTRAFTRLQASNLQTSLSRRALARDARRQQRLLKPSRGRTPGRNKQTLTMKSLSSLHHSRPKQSRADTSSHTTTLTNQSRVFVCEISRSRSLRGLLASELNTGKALAGLVYISELYFHSSCGCKQFAVNPHCLAPAARYGSSSFQCLL